MTETIKHIVLVDDESGVLQAMKRMLRSQREEWEMNFFSSGQDALEFRANKACDVIVTDMRMPGMDGVRLLTTVNEKYPHVVRIVLPGHAERDTVMRAVEPSHQYLAKPCKADTLRETISRACALRSLLTNDSLQTVVGKVSKLPYIEALSMTDHLDAWRELALSTDGNED